ncbi:unnamed protein product [Closterium sp. NIES-54]
MFATINPTGAPQGTEAQGPNPTGAPQGTEAQVPNPTGAPRGTEAQGTEAQVPNPTGAPRGTEAQGPNPTGAPQGTEAQVPNPTGAPRGTEAQVSNPTGAPRGTETQVPNPTGAPRGTEAQVLNPIGGPQGTEAQLPNPIGGPQGTEAQVPRQSVNAGFVPTTVTPQQPWGRRRLNARPNRAEPHAGVPTAEPSARRHVNARQNRAEPREGVPTAEPSANVPTEQPPETLDVFEDDEPKSDKEQAEVAASAEPEAGEGYRPRAFRRPDDDVSPKDEAEVRAEMATDELADTGLKFKGGRLIADWTKLRAGMTQQEKIDFVRDVFTSLLPAIREQYYSVIREFERWWYLEMRRLRQNG